MAVTIDGKLYGWGWNKFGQVGVGDNTNHCSPVQVKFPLDQVIKIKDIIRPPDKADYNDVYIAYELMDTDLHQIIGSSQELTKDHCQKLVPGVSAQLLEYDKRFEQYGDEFSFYDYNQPEDLPLALKHSFPVVVADPPYLVQCEELFL